MVNIFAVGVQYLCYGNNIIIVSTYFYIPFILKRFELCLSFYVFIKLILVFELIANNCS